LTCGWGKAAKAEEGGGGDRAGRIQRSSLTNACPGAPLVDWLKWMGAAVGRTGLETWSREMCGIVCNEGDVRRGASI
jgi:hypothetical protein